jgi:RNA polymerase sigma-70 factor (ECF subfamily)
MGRVQSADDHLAFAHLVGKWEKPIRDLCTRMIGDIHRGADLKQETFSRLYAKRREYKPTGKFSSYLWRMALNVCYDELRRGRRHPAAPWPSETGGEAGRDLAADQTTPREQAAQAEEGRLVRDAIQALPEIYREVIILRHYENLKLREIAEVLNVPPGTVNSRMAEALDRLSQRLGPHFHTKNQTTPPSSHATGAPELSLL